MALPRANFYQRYAQRALDQLVSERGVHIAHTYLDTWRTQEPFASWSLLAPEGDGFVLREEADALFARLAEHDLVVEQDRAAPVY